MRVVAVSVKGTIKYPRSYMICAVYQTRPASLWLQGTCFCCMYYLERPAGWFKGSCRDEGGELRTSCWASHVSCRAPTSRHKRYRGLSWWHEIALCAVCMQTIEYDQMLYIVSHSRVSSLGTRPSKNRKEGLLFYRIAEEPGYEASQSLGMIFSTEEGTEKQIIRFHPYNKLN